MNNLVKISCVSILAVGIGTIAGQLKPKLINAQNISNDSSQIKLFPDWSKISFSDFEPIGQGGKINSNADKAAGWKVSREWAAGDRIEDILKLGDLAETLSPELFSLRDIQQRAIVPIDSRSEVDTNNLGIEPIDATLEEFGVVKEQTLGSLVEANPELAAEQVSAVEPVADLLKQNGVEYRNTSIEEITNDRRLKELKFSSLDLDRYSVDSIPGMADTPIKDFDNYEEISVSEVPGLDRLPLSDYPNPVNAAVNFVGRIDFIWGNAEIDANRTISGSKIDGFKVPCKSQCSHLELDDIENFGRSIATGFEGNQWIAGRDTEWVNGGTGCLSGGKEPTGIHPFGDTFKSVLWDTDETTDTANIVSFFNVKTNCGDSAYFIGPFPFPLGQVKINDWVFLGTGQ